MSREKMLEHVPKFTPTVLETDPDQLVAVMDESESYQQLGTDNSVEEVKSKEKVEKHHSESEEDWLWSSSEELEEHNICCQKCDC